MKKFIKECPQEQYLWESKKIGSNKGMRWTVKQLQQRCWQNSLILKFRWLFGTAHSWGKRGQVLEPTMTIYWIQAAPRKGMLRGRRLSSTDGNSQKGFRLDPTDNTHQCRWILSQEGGILIAKHNVYCIVLVCTCQISDLFIPCFFFLSLVHLDHLTYDVFYSYVLFIMSSCLYRIAPKEECEPTTFLKSANPVK